MNKLTLAAVLLLGACQSTPEPEVVTEQVFVETYPYLENIEKADELVMDRVEFDVPRDMDAKPVLKGTHECYTLAQAGQDVPEKCYVQPPIENSNVVLGLTAENLENLRLNIRKMTKREKYRQKQIEQVNRQREAWRKQTDGMIKDVPETEGK